MEFSEYRRFVKTPIPGDSVVGERLIDDPLYDFIEEQMMKVGSLSHATVQWHEVEHSIIKLLTDKTKDIKLLVYLLQCLHNRITPGRLSTSFAVMGDFISAFWDSSYPAPGKRGKLPRRKYFSQMVQRFAMVIEKVDFSQFDSQDRELLLNSVAGWESAIEKAQLPGDIVAVVVGTVKREINKAEQRQKVAAAIHPPLQSPVTTATGNHLSSLSVDSSSDKAIKQSLLKVANYMAEQEFGTAVAVRVRRFSVWGCIHSLPDHDANGETMLRGMQKDRLKEYQEKLRQPDLVLWRKIEQSLTNAPFWFEGHLMSYQIAEALGKSDWGDAIRNETRLFIARLPGLCKLSFKGGEPFVPSHVQDWLDETQFSVSDKRVTGSWNEIRKEAISLAKEGGIAVALSMLNDGLIKATEPRDCFYWRFLLADVMRCNCLDEMAKAQYNTLHDQVLSMSVIDWEPSLIQEIKQFTTSD